MKKFVCFIIFGCTFFITKSQDTYNSVGVTASYFASTSSQPIVFKPYTATSIGVLVEQYYNNHRKLSTGISYYEHRFEQKYRDIDSAKGIASNKGISQFLTVPIAVSYNFMKTDATWEFFVDAGFLNFIHLKTTEINTHTTVAEKRFTKVSTHTFTNHYFMVGITARFKLNKNLFTGLGTKTHHYLKLSRRINTGFPTISVEANINYIF